MTIKEAQEAVDKWIKEYGVRYFSELTNMACLTEEVGELARVIARTYGEERKWLTFSGFSSVWLTKRVSILPKNSRKASTRRPKGMLKDIRITRN